MAATAAMMVGYGAHGSVDIWVSFSAALIFGDIPLTLGARARPQLKAADAARREGEATHRAYAGSARQKPHPRVALSRASGSVQGAAKASPGGHQDGRYWRSRRASLIIAADLLTLAAKAPPRTREGGTRGGLTAVETARLALLLVIAAER
jgi:hypothetical protein